MRTKTGSPESSTRQRRCRRLFILRRTSANTPLRTESRHHRAAGSQLNTCRQASSHRHFASYCRAKSACMRSTCSGPDLYLGCFSQQQDAEPLSQTWPGGQCRRHRSVRTEHHSPAPSDSSHIHPHGPLWRNHRPAAPAQTMAGITRAPRKPPAVGMLDKGMRSRCQRPLRPLYYWRSGGMMAFQKEELLQSGAYRPATQGLGALPRRPLSPPRPIFPASMPQLADACQRPATPATRRASPPRLILAMQSRRRRRLRPRPPVVHAVPSLGSAISWQS